MPNVVNEITEKMKGFCRAYVANGGDATHAYLTAYNGKSETAAQIEGCKLLRDNRIQKYIDTLNAPFVEQARSERQKKREWLWNMIQTADKNSDRIAAMNILNKMDGEYNNLLPTEKEESSVSNLDTNTLLKLIN